MVWGAGFLRAPTPAGATRPGGQPQEQQQQQQADRQAAYAPAGQDVYAAYGGNNAGPSAGTELPAYGYGQYPGAAGPKYDQGEQAGNGQFAGQAAPPYGSGPYAGQAAPQYGGGAYPPPGSPPRYGDIESGPPRYGQQAAAPPPPPVHSPVRPSPQHGGHNGDISTAEAKWNRDIRRAFTRKVLFIVFLQLCLTTAIAITFYIVDPIQNYLRANVWPTYASWALAFGVLIFMACSTRARRKYPVNYIFLLVFTLVFSVMVGTITARYDVQAIGIALAVTTATVLGAFCVAAFTKLDLTKYGGFLTAILFGVIVMIILGIFWNNKWWYLLISIIAAILFTAFLIYDLQMLMGGGAREVSPDEYIFAAANIYLDIVQIFLNVLNIVSFAQG